MLPVEYKSFQPEFFGQVIELGNRVHGDNYLDLPVVQELYKKSFQNELNASIVALNEDRLIGFRLTIAPRHWAPDKWCTPSKWAISQNKVSYFKCNTVDSNYQGQGIGPQMLQRSVEQSLKQGAQAGLAHIWLASPNNSAYRYFKKCGGELIKEHPNKWRALSLENQYDCPVCGRLCNCTAAEMILRF